MATYYSSHSAGGGGSGTIGSPFTLQELFDAVTSADLGLVMATGTYTPSAKLDLDTNTGTVTARPTIRGCASDGTDDGTVATISGSSTASSTTLLQIANTIDYLRLENLRFTASKNYGIDINSHGCVFKKVRVDNAASHGFYQQTLADITTLIDCEIDNNVGAGWTGGFTSRGNVVIINGSVHNNGSFGVRCAVEGVLDRVLIYKNGSHGVVLALDASALNTNAIKHCTIAANSGSGIDCVSGTTRPNVVISDTILYENTAFGIDLNGSDADIFTFVRMCAHNNSSGAIDTGSLPSDTITSDPAFANEGAGTEDYTPSLSTLKITRSSMSGIGGSSYGWIGAIQPNGSSGGGSALHLGALGQTGIGAF